MSQQASYDVIVVGGGGAGMCAALSARENGASVLVLERAPQDKRGGNTAFASGTFRMVHHGANDIRRVVPDLTEQEIASTDFGEYSAEQYFDDLGRITQYHSDPDLSDVLVHQSADTVDWLHELGVRFMPELRPAGVQDRRPIQVLRRLGDLRQRRRRGLMDAHFKAAEQLGIDVRYRARGIALLRGANGIEGVRVEIDGVPEETSVQKPWCSRVAASRPTANGGRAISAPAGTWRRCGAPVTTPATASAWRSTSARNPTANGQAATAVAWERNAGDYGDVETRHNGFRHSYPFGIMVNADGKRFSMRARISAISPTRNTAASCCSSPAATRGRCSIRRSSPYARRVQAARRDEGARRYARRVGQPHAGRESRRVPEDHPRLQLRGEARREVRPQHQGR